MSVEILILSGSRLGERFHTDRSEFRVGGTPQCDLFFDPLLDAGARNQAVTFALQEDGWRVRCLGILEVRINNVLIEGVSRIRSGDVVKLSPCGPDLSFQILGRSSTTATTHTPQQMWKARLVSEAQSSHIPAAGKHRATALTLGFVAVVLTVVMVGWRLSTGTPSLQPIAKTSEHDDDSIHKDDEKVKIATEPNGRADHPSSTPTEKSPPTRKTDSIGDRGFGSVESAPISRQGPEDVWDRVLEKSRNAIFLLAVEEPKTFSTWPVASACAVGKNALLTSASAIMELATFQQKGWKLLAINEPSGVRTEIKALRVHVGYTKSGDEPAQRIYFDVGLAMAEMQFGAVADLARPEELNVLEPGVVLGCIGIPREVEALNRFQVNDAELFKTKIFVITTLPPAPGPRLLHLRADLAIKPYGSAFFNSQGKICAIFAESAAGPTSGAADLKLHYAPVIDPKLIELGLSSAEGDIWVVPPPSAKPLVRDE